MRSFRTIFLTILATPCLVQQVNESTNVRRVSEFYTYVFEIRFLYDSVRVVGIRSTRRLVSEGNLTSVCQKDVSWTHTSIETEHSFWYSVQKGWSARKKPFFIGFIITNGNIRFTEDHRWTELFFSKFKINYLTQCNMWSWQPH